MELIDYGNYICFKLSRSSLGQEGNNLQPYFAKEEGWKKDTRHVQETGFRLFWVVKMNFIKKKMNESQLFRYLYFKTEKVLYPSSNPIIKKCLQYYIYNKVQGYSKQPPQVVNIENTNFCNAKCPMCPNSTMQRRKGFMTDKDYKYTIDQLVDLGTKKINLHSIGEPLMDKRFVEKIKYAKAFNLEVITTTNASLLNEVISKNILNAELDEICFSIDAYRKVRFEKIRKQLNRDIVYKNIENFLALREKMESKISVKVRAINLVNNEADKIDLKEFKSFWSSYPVVLQISNLHSWNRAVQINIGNKSVHGKNVLLNYPCDLLWTEPLVTYDIKVLACCYDYDGTIVIGDLRKQSFKDIWFKNDILERERYRHLIFRENRPTPCNTCEITPGWFKL